MAMGIGISRHLAGLCCLLWGSAGAAQTLGMEPPPRVIEDRLRLELSASAASIDTNARVDETAQLPGTLFSSEDDLGLGSSAFLPRVELTLLPGERHLIRLSSLRVRRTGTNVLERDINYDGEIYRTGESVRSNLDLDLLDVTYGYQFLRRPRGDLAATAGVLIGSLSTNAEVIGRVTLEPITEVLPLPVIGMEGRVHVFTRWTLEGRIQYTKLDADLKTGTLSALRLAVHRQMNPHVSVGLGYRYFALEAESLDAETSGLLDMQFNGFELFVRASL